jgi:glycosyltransferase involved in cell wall biosynthesis
MRVVYCSDRYWPAVGGAEVYIRTVAQEMAREHMVKVVTLIRDQRSLAETIRRPTVELNSSMNQDGHVQVVTLELSRGLRAASQLLPLEPLAHRLFGHDYYLIRSLWLRYIARLLASPLEAELRGADIIHSVAPWELSHAVNLVRGDIPHVATGLLHPGHWADDDNSLRHFRKCDHIIALSNSERQAYRQLGIPDCRISVVRIPIKEPGAHEDQLSWSFPININEPFVLFLGVKREYKGVDLLLEAAAHVWDVIPEARFVFVGPRTDYSEALFAAPPHDPRIIELDAIPEGDKWNLLKQCTLMCLPSETEIMPNVILEAWLMRKPVITSDIPTLREFVGDAGLCVARTALSLAQAIVYLMQHRAISAALGERGWKKSRYEHSASAVRSTLENIYYALTGRDSSTLEE